MAKHKKESHAPRLGQSYRAGTTAIVALSPVVDEVINSAQSRKFNTLPANLKAKLTTGTAANLVVGAIDAALDSKMGHSAALSRGSITAWLPEGIRLGATATGGGARFGGGTTGISARGANAAFARSTTGYDPTTATWNPGDASFWTYQGFKRGGQVARKVANMPFGKRILAPVKKGLKALGLSF